MIVTVAARHVPSEEGGVDWRRLAADRNVSHSVARALWQHAQATAPGDLVQAERAYHTMLDEAEAANATHEPGRETLVGAAPGASDAASLGAGKWTRVLLEEQKTGGPAAAAKRAAQAAAKTERTAEGDAEGKTANAKPSAEELHQILVAAAEASKHAAALLTTSDPATIVEALRELRETAGPGVLQKIMTAAGGAIERILSQRPPDAAAPTGPVGDPAQGSPSAEAATTASAPAATSAAEASDAKATDTKASDAKATDAKAKMLGSAKANRAANNADPIKPTGGRARSSKPRRS